MLQEPGSHTSEDARRPSQHRDQPVPHPARSPADPSPAQAGLEEPRLDQGGRQRCTRRRRRVPTSVPTSTMELFRHGRAQSRRIDLRQNSQERQVDPT